MSQTKAIIDAGVCGFTTTVHADSDDAQSVKLTIESDCPHVSGAAEELTEVDAYQELFPSSGPGKVRQILDKHLPHPTCPVYSGVLKAAEAAAGLALPRDVQISVSLADQ